MRILEATLEVAAERGYDGTSIARVTEATGLPASSIYWHFKNKDELFAATLEYSYRRWRAATPTWEEEVVASGTEEEIRERLRRASRAISVSPEFWRLGLMLALENRPAEPAARRRYLEVRQETRAAIRTWWAQVLPESLGVGREQAADRLARFHLAIMDGFFVGIRSGADWDLERLVDLVAVGMHARAQQWKRGVA